MAITPHTDNYTIGKGILSIGAWIGDVPPTEYVDVGNAVSIEVEHTVERLPHFSSRSGLRTKDKNPVIQTEYSVAFVLDEISAANLVLLLSGTRDGAVIHALQTANTEYAIQFVSDNPLGPNRTHTFWKVTLTPSGPMVLIGEEWMQLAYLAEGIADITNHASSPYYDIEFATTTTTTTTSSSTTSSTTTTSSTSPP